MKKVIKLADAVEMIPDGAALMIGGFMAVGSPHRLIDELVRQRKRDLTVIANDTARPGQGVGKLIVERLVARVITSHIGLNPETQKQMIQGDIQVELVPQGTLAERIRAGGFGLGGVLTPTGVGTVVEEGKQTVEIDGRTFLLEKPLKADFALINAKRAD
ncbi:MAG TPA: 3-oxoacid CoA-transferase subunit A, partial [Azospirillum sp.]|nr:3-oxoacid CoA-transferase subunit A [Azospirillum sp.]